MGATSNRSLSLFNRRLPLGCGLLAGALALASTGGWGSGVASGSDGAATNSGPAHLRATLDGQPWAGGPFSEIATASPTVPGTLMIQGVELGTSSAMSLTLGYINGPATYPLGVNAGTTPGGIGAITDSTGGAWIADLTGASGSITIATLSGGHVSGTFQFVAPPAPGNAKTNTRTVTDGDFDLPLPTFTSHAADDYGSTLSATLDGQPFNAATVVGGGSGSTGAFALSVSTSAMSLNLTTLSAVSNGGTCGQSAVMFQAVNTPTGQGYGGANALSSVTVTSLTTTRVAGTFIATLPPLTGMGSPLILSNGKFDSRIAN